MDDETDRGQSRATELEDVEIPLASKETLIRTKDTVRPSDAADIDFLKLSIEREDGSSA